MIFISEFIQIFSYVNHFFLKFCNMIIKFFHETVGLVNSVCPRQIYNEVQTILGFNGSDEVYQNNGYTDIICSNDIVCLEKDFSRDLWFVRIKDVATYVLKNKPSAKQTYRLILKDISNYINLRWRRLI